MFIEVERGFLWPLGPNGAGKSTLIKIFTTLLLPTSGSVSVLDMMCLKKKMKLDGKFHCYRWRMSSYGLLSVYEQLTMFYAILITKNDAKNKINELLEIVGLDN